MENLSRTSGELVARMQRPPDAPHDAPGSLDVTGVPRGAVRDPTNPEPAITAVPASPSERPWVGERVMRGLLFAVPVAILMWIGIIWLLFQIFS